MSPETADADPNTAVARAMPSTRIVGAPATAVAGLDELAGDTGADEIMVSTVAHGLETRLRSLELLAGAWASVPPAAPVDQLVHGDAG